MKQTKAFFSKSGSDLFDRIWFTLLLLIVFRLGSFIPIPGIDSGALSEIATRNQAGVLGMFNVLSGGALGRMSIFALAIMPYITASIVMQLLSVAYKPLEDLKKEGEAGRRTINQISRYLTIALATLQAYGVAVSLQSASTSLGSVVIISATFFKVSTVLTLVVGTMFLMWLGEQITARGIGNGSSLIIFFGIVSGLPSAVINLFEFSRKGVISYLSVLIICISMILIVAFIVFLEKAFCKVNVQNPGNRAQAGQAKSNYIPIKINMSGVIPPMFASSVLLFPATLANFYKGDSAIMEWFMFNFGRGKPAFLICYMLLIFFFSFFYASVVFNAEEISSGLKKSGVFLPGRRPGKATAEYLDYVVSRITVISAVYLCVICIVPEVIMNKISSFTLGGTSLLICVSVVIDTFSQIQSYGLNRQYENLVKKIRFS